MFGLGVPELLLILFIIMLLFGARKLPDLAAGLGGAVNSFKKALKGDEENVKTIDARTTSSGDQVPSQTKTESKT
jgi:sec-independent protein translocase protein TatA